MALAPDELIGPERMLSAWRDLVRSVRQEAGWTGDDVWDAWRDLHHRHGLSELHKRRRTLEKLVAGTQVPDPVSYDLLRAMFNARLIELSKEPMMPPFLADQRPTGDGTVTPLPTANSNGPNTPRSPGAPQHTCSPAPLPTRGKPRVKLPGEVGKAA